MRVTSNANAATTFGQNVFVVGSIPALRNWAHGSAVALSSARYPIWSATVSVPRSTAFQYRYLKKNEADGPLRERREAVRWVTRTTRDTVRV